MGRLKLGTERRLVDSHNFGALQTEAGHQAALVEGEAAAGSEPEVIKKGKGDEE